MTEKGYSEALAAGLFRRLRDVILVAERIEDYAFGAGDPEKKRPALSEGDAPALAHDLVLRALRLASDATNWRILAAAADGEQGFPIEELATLCALPRLAVTERSNELIQAGLCLRAIDADRIVVTEAGLALLDFVAAVTADLARRAEESAGKERANGERGLPVL